MKFMMKLQYIFPIAGEEQIKAKYFKRTGKKKHREDNCIFLSMVRILGRQTNNSISVLVFFRMYTASF